VKKRPNFLFFITDQQRADYLGCSGHPVLKTPNIDRISRQGTTFSRCYVSNPVCMPNRAALMTGRMSSVNGVHQNGNDLPLHMTTFTQILQAGGYDTALLGKSHFQTMTTVPPPIGGNPAGKGRLANAVYIGDDSMYHSELTSEWLTKGDNAVGESYYGFDVARVVSNHGDRTGAAHETWLRKQVANPDSLRGPENQLPHNYTCPQAIRTAMPEELYSTAYIKGLTKEYLADPARHESPFFAFVSFPDPHHPFTPPGKYWDLYRPEDMHIPHNFGSHSNPPPHLSWVREQPPATGNAFRTSATSLNERHLREAMALTCGMIGMIDDAIGEIVVTLKEAGLADDTILVFTSDHGDLLGDHGLILKGGLHFQGLIRVPLLWYDPSQQQPASVSTLCSTIDLAPTIMSRAGLQAYAGVQGLDLSPLIADEKSTLRREQLLIEEDMYRPDILGFEGRVRIRSLVTGRFRLTVFEGVDWGELYDLDEDPFETRNLWDDVAAAEKKQELLWQLSQTMLGYMDRSPWPKQEA
jgi:arylsulfatase A-like enzyme